MKLSLAIAASLTLVALPVTAEKPVREFFYCVSNKIGEPTGYVGGIYQVPRGDPTEIAHDFRIVVQKQFAPEVPLGAGCYGFPTVAAAESARTRRIADLSTTQAIVEVEWRYGTLPAPGTMAAKPEASRPPVAPFPTAPATPSATNASASVASTSTGG